MAKETAWHNHKIEKPKNDNEYFERMSRVIFLAGLNWRVIDKKWPGLKIAFSNFDINKVSNYKEQNIEELLNNPDVIHNLAKIRAVIKNANELKEIIKEFGSIESYIKSLGSDEDNLIKSLTKRFAFLGKSTSVIFLYSIGVSLPKTHEKWLRQQ
ncbi:MAG TPA: DNA-3-methyladenine glycosylase I [Patescibacteria group bacterium]|nr:DNA-3-methyladenine glycosylase I [Patescibacteria group bacterium]